MGRLFGFFLGNLLFFFVFRWLGELFGLSLRIASDEQIGDSKARFGEKLEIDCKGVGELLKKCLTLIDLHYYF